ncbi:hypothetical protein GH714_000097 [Hevea brasiliensis]|uniref:Uncharacterized protein n=1 Tax=Hevea brasiliensis TaxID=3981 RepID=A0A6A6LHP3_HEVBR|nr:hypothetical protein GH714_000097 [Hevea brasiliensis]
MANTPPVPVNSVFGRKVVSLAYTWDENKKRDNTPSQSQLRPPKKTKALAKRYKPKISESLLRIRSREAHPFLLSGVLAVMYLRSRSLLRIRSREAHPFLLSGVLAVMYPRSRSLKSPCSSSKVSNTSGTSSETPSGADSSFTGDTSFEDTLGLNKRYRAQSPLRVTMLHRSSSPCDFFYSDLTSPKVPTTSTLALITSSTPSSSTISG